MPGPARRLKLPAAAVAAAFGTLIGSAPAGITRVELSRGRGPWPFPPHTTMAHRRAGRPTPPCAIWLLLVAALVFCMIVVGGAVRLTDSGLSITEWQPLLGAIPPLNEADWLAAFEKYKAIPEYSVVNAGMSLEASRPSIGGSGRTASSGASSASPLPCRSSCSG